MKGTNQMPAIANSETTRSTDPATYGAAPVDAVPISPSLDMTLVTTFRDIIRKSGTLANGRVYPSKDDEQFKSDLRFMRKHLAPTVVKDSERIKVVMYGQPGSVSFFLTIATKKPRKAKATA
jgi:hypothetical protein